MRTRLITIATLGATLLVAAGVAIAGSFTQLAQAKKRATHSS